MTFPSQQVFLSNRCKTKASLPRMMHSLRLNVLREWRAYEVALFYSVMLEFHLIPSLNWSTGAVSSLDMTSLVWSVIIVKGGGLTRIYICPLLKSDA